MSNFWSEDITRNLTDAPVTLLREYAESIGEGLNHKLIAEVRRRNYNVLSEMNKTVSQLAGSNIRPNPSPNFYYTFEIVAPLLNNYRYELFVVSFDIQMYPVKLYLDEDILHEIAPNLKDEYYGPLAANDSTEMKTLLQSILNTQKTITVIRSLLSMINEHQTNGILH